MNKRLLKIERHFNLLLLIFCLPIWLTAQEITEADIGSKRVEPSKFAVYISYGNFNLIRNPELFTSPLIQNEFPSFGAGIMTYLANKNIYKFKFYLGYLKHGVVEEFISDDGDSFTSELQFSTLQSSIHPLNLGIPFKKFRVYLGAGAYANYNFGYNISLSPSREQNIDDELFLPISYGVIAQAGISFNKIDFEINAYNSMSDIIDTNITQSPSYVGLTAQLVLNF